MTWPLIRRTAMLVALTSAVCSIGCSSKKEGLVLFDVDVAPSIPSVHLLRFSVDGHAEIPPHEASGDPRPSHLFFGYYMPGVSGSVTVLSEALDGDNCVVGRGSATVDHVQPGKTSPDENTPKSLSINAVLPVICDRDASTSRDAATGGRDSSTGDSRPADSKTVDSAVGDATATDSRDGDFRTGDPGGADSSLSDAGGGMGGSSGAAGQPGGMGAGGNPMADGGTAGSTGAGGMGVGGSRAAMITASASSMDFARVEISVEQSPRTWTITNNGDLATSPLTFSSADTSDIIAINNCPTTLLGGAQCTITVAVKASMAGPISGDLRLAAAQGGSASLAVTATGSVRLTVTTSGTGTVTSIPGGIACGSTCSALFDSGATVTLQARTANGSGFFFSTWSGGGCAGPSRDCQLGIPTTSVTTQATFAPMSSNLIFVSSGTFPPNRGSAAAYDSDCNDAATGAGINDANGGAFTAVTSDAASTVVTRLGTASGWVRMDGRPFADTPDGLFQRNQVFNSIRYNERGEVVGTSTIVMTGTSPAGLTNSNCSNWTTADASAVFLVGNPDGGPTRWTDLGTATRPDCSQGPFRIICMGHSKTATVTPARASGRLIWLSAALYYNGNPAVTAATPPDQVCQSEKPPGVTTAAALLAYATRGASAVLSATTNYVRADGVLVGTGDQLSTAGTLESGIWQSADGTYRLGGGPAGMAVTGGPGGPASNTCSDWTSVNGTGVVGDYGIVTAGNWWNMTTLGFCQSPPKYIYCVQTAP